MRQDRDKTGHQSDLVFRKFTDKTELRSGSDLETGQRQDRTPLRSSLEAVHIQDRAPFRQ